MPRTPTVRSGRRWPSCLVVLVLLPLGCGPTVDVDDGSSSSSGAVESSGAPTTVTTTVTTTVSTVASDGADGTTSTSTDTGEPPSGYEDDGVDTGCAFTCPNPPPPPPSGGGWCNITCFDGEKCMPWANDGGMVWNAVRCSPIADQAGAPGDPCTVEGWQWSGVDDCEEGSLCWQADPETHEGVCHAFCGGTEDQPLCPAGSDCVTLPEFVPLCVVSCDPLVPSCDPSEQCLPSGSGFTCVLRDGMGAALGEPCGDPWACEVGLCAFDPAFSCGNAPGEGCCAAPCDVSAPGLCDGPGSLCVPWFPLRPPPELAHLGACVP